MNMEITRLVNASWRQIPDCQVIAIHSVRLSQNETRTQLETPPPVPMLDWPPTLFDDEQSCH
jgi:hypothetical protein